MANEGWRIPAEMDPASAEVVLSVATPRSVALRQGEAAIELTTAQLGELADRAFYLHELMRAEQSDVAEGWQPTW
ncbi:MULTISPECIES: hypothetical protein [unclassified Saccharopolyspora]|uniref:hypothetical protein n=1 Tax=unclassified Saccharopolyspora TaxID=2646250 RepID=UPI001CD2913F|nr:MULTISPECIES: hypothetical protein [unclassified Saccharopolyspora]MCA1191484.1 hypothetical protein [Saccharopolyspora sp. 6V]MCA1226842.1 hypothetical protein [Saccharopolyspora sp. 6M]MCA1280714.1 hypothetical protein [Saccharopolyspora sp. 7B]